MNDDWSFGVIGVAVGAVIAGLFAWLTQRSKGETDERLAVRAEWEKLTSALAGRLADVEKELADLRAQSSKDMAELRKQHANELDEMRKAHRVEMHQMRDLNEGLQRMIAQNSQSAAHLMGERPVPQRTFPEEDDE